MSARALWAVLLAVGCLPYVRTTELNPSPRPMSPRAPSDVEVYAAGRPSYRYVDVALIESSYEGGGRLETIREHAARMGCDAVVVLEGIDREKYGHVRGYRAACVVRADTPPPQPAPTVAVDVRFSKTMTVSARFAVVRVAPADIAREVVRLPAGSVLAAEVNAERQWRRVRLADGRLGYARDAELVVAGPAVRRQ